MTPLETLAKYGLDTSYKMVKARLEQNTYFDRIIGGGNGNFDLYVSADDLRSADLTLLCSLAEKGERWERAVKDYQDMLVTLEHGMFSVPELIRAFKYIIAEAEGEGK